MFSIGQVARLTNIKEHNIRSWQSSLPFIEISIGNGGRRYYNRKAIEQLVRINYLIRNMKLKINGIKHMFEYDPSSIDRLQTPHNIYPKDEDYDRVSKNKYMVSDERDNKESSANFGLTEGKINKIKEILDNLHSIVS